MDIRVSGDEIYDSGDKIGVISGGDIYTKDGKKIGRIFNDGDVFDADGNNVGYGNKGVLELFIKNLFL
ncbi:hypothetical protein FACS189475_01020 [Betaproteobacteria bacterium]|nr:hypothetical protein FACS189475_01020 [Betaproteobacteria bacterium]